MEFTTLDLKILLTVKRCTAEGDARRWARLDNLLNMSESQEFIAQATFVGVDWSKKRTAVLPFVAIKKDVLLLMNERSILSKKYAISGSINT